MDWLARLPYPVTLAVEGFGDVMFCHATPRDDEEVVVVDSRLDRWAEILTGLPEQTMTVVPRGPNRLYRGRSAPAARDLVGGGQDA